MLRFVICVCVDWKNVFTIIYEINARVVYDAGRRGQLNADWKIMSSDDNNQTARIVLLS